MSLVGNLEDLSLGDIMQILSLSAKSGVLVLQSGTKRGGRILFRDGKVCAAVLKGQPTPEGDVAALNDAVEAAVLEMFRWQRGDFSFDVRQAADPEDPGFELEVGLNPQYLAMEGMRIRDEAARAEETDVAPEAEAAPPEPVAPTEAEPASGEADPFADWTFGEDEDDVTEVGLPPDPIDDLNFAEVVVDGGLVEDKEEVPVSAPQAAAVPPAPAPAPSRAARRLAGEKRSRPLILIEADAVFLEWAKGAYREAFNQVHVFQQADQGLARIRQYLIRGQFPVVVISDQAEIDPLSGIHGLADFAKRLKTQAPRLPIYCLFESESDVGGTGTAPTAPASFDGSLMRPTRHRLKSWNEADSAMAGQDWVARLLVMLEAPPSR